MITNLCSFVFDPDRFHEQVSWQCSGLRPKSHFGDSCASVVFVRFRFRYSRALEKTVSEPVSILEIHVTGLTENSRT